MQGTDGNLYGTTYNDGGSGGGTVFKITPSGTLTTLYNFCSQGPSCPDGQLVLAGLVQASDGNFYGVTTEGGTNGHGAVFKITPSGTFTVLHSFDFDTEGSNPGGTLIQSSDGNF